MRRHKKRKKRQRREKREEPLPIDLLRERMSFIHSQSLTQFPLQHHTPQCPPSKLLLALLFPAARVLGHRAFALVISSVWSILSLLLTVTSIHPQPLHRALGL
jgi:hypothetical protein